jgi:putative DeoR family transcriptional regulator (stage III sporulation protein D)
LKGYIEERAIDIANYIIEQNATVRQTAKKLGISKNMVHMVVIK